VEWLHEPALPYLGSSTVVDAEPTVFSKHLALLDHRRVAVKGERYAQLRVVATVHEPEFRRRNSQARACRDGEGEGEGDESVGRGNHCDRHFRC
jgi:hypothetical protein